MNRNPLNQDYLHLWARRSYRKKMALWILIMTFVTALNSAGQTAGSQNNSSGDVKNGKRLYTTHGCFECHGREAQGSSAGPQLGPRPSALAGFARYVRQPAGQMPPYTTKVLSDSELGDIHAYLRSLPTPSAAKDIPLLKQSVTRPESPDRDSPAYGASSARRSGRSSSS